MKLFSSRGSSAVPETLPNNPNQDQAFYQSNSVLVPVRFLAREKFNEDTPHLILDEFRFEAAGPDGSHQEITVDERGPASPARYAENVTLVYRTEDQRLTDDDEMDETREYRVPAPFFMGGSKWENRDVRVTPDSQMSQETLAQHLARAYWSNFEERSWDEVKEQRDDLGTWARTEAQYFQNPQDGLLQETSEWLNRFSTGRALKTRRGAPTAKPGTRWTRLPESSRRSTPNTLWTSGCPQMRYRHWATPWRKRD